MASETISQNAALDEFMAEYRSETWANPVDGRTRGITVEDEGVEGYVVMEIKTLRPPHWPASVHISSIMSSPTKKGFASFALDMLCSMSDNHGVALTLTAKKFGTVKSALTNKQLKQWYQRRGFKFDGDEGTRQPKRQNPAPGPPPPFQNDPKKWSAVLKAAEVPRVRPVKLGTKEHGPNFVYAFGQGTALKFTRDNAEAEAAFAIFRNPAPETVMTVNGVWRFPLDGVNPLEAARPRISTTWWNCVKHEIYTELPDAWVTSINSFYKFNTNLSGGLTVEKVQRWIDEEELLGENKVFPTHASWCLQLAADLTERGIDWHDFHAGNVLWDDIELHPVAIDIGNSNVEGVSHEDIPTIGGGDARNNPQSIILGSSPLQYKTSGTVSRLMYVDTEAPPHPKTATYFAHTATKINGRVQPGAAEGVVSFLDFEELPDGGVFIHYMATRNDQRRKSYAGMLVAELYTMRAYAKYIDWGNIMHDAAKKMFLEYNRIQKPPTRGSVR